MRDPSTAMEQHDDLIFDDPALKESVRRAWAGETGPQRLRGRVSRLIATAGAGAFDNGQAEVAAAITTWDRWRGRAYGLVAAAVILFGVGLLVLHYDGAFDHNRGAFARSPVGGYGQVNTISEVPVGLGQAMVARHEACAAQPDHHLIQGLVGSNYGALNLKLTADLGFPALARSIGPEWTFKGAGTCDVGALRGSHLLFTRGDQTVSLFSLPTQCMGGASGGALYQGSVDNHPIAGFARGGGVYCVVGSSPSQSLSLDTLIGIRDGLHGLFDTAGCSEDVSGFEDFN